MLVKQVLSARGVQQLVRRNFGASAVLVQKASDPIQQLFVDKVREYGQKKKTSGGKFVDATPRTEMQLQKELDKVAKQYGGGDGIDMTKFPSLSFKDPVVG